MRIRISKSQQDKLDVEFAADTKSKPVKLTLSPQDVAVLLSVIKMATAAEVFSFEYTTQGA